MDRQELYERLTEVFRDIFGDSDLTICGETSAENLVGWDSFRHISLLAAIEDEFEVTFSIKEAASMKNVGEMVQYIEEQLP